PPRSLKGSTPSDFALLGGNLFRRPKSRAIFSTNDFNELRPRAEMKSTGVRARAQETRSCPINPGHIFRSETVVCRHRNIIRRAAFAPCHVCALQKSW